MLFVTQKFNFGKLMFIHKPFNKRNNLFVLLTWYVCSLFMSLELNMKIPGMIYAH
jgi:hypothetical protein